VATPEQRARRRAQRATAKAVRERRRQLPASITARARAASPDYGHDVIAGVQPEPAPGTPEARSLARLGSLARYGKADPAFLVFEKFYYHKPNASMGPPIEDEDESAQDDEEDE
jgi:hypothetical protein